MACSSCGNKVKRVIQSTTNLVKAAIAQPDAIKWFKDGVTGLIKCIGHDTPYTDEQVINNREVCRGCPHASKTDGKMTVNSQCMAPDPTKNGAPCGCFIICKTQVGACPLGKWTQITVDKKPMGS